MFEEPRKPCIDVILSEFTASRVLPRHPALAPRFEAARTRLLAYLATDARHVLLPDEHVVLTAERQFRPEGAFVRVFGAEVLLAALPGFLDDGWLPRHVYDARAQIQFVELLCDWVVVRALLGRSDSSCLVYGVKDAARDARTSLERPSSGPGARPSRAGGAGGRVGS